MGIDIGASIVVGLPQEDFEDLVKNYEDPNDYLFEKDLEIVSPYYDAQKGCIWGVRVYNIDYTYLHLSGDLLVDIEVAHQRFKRITGLEGSLYLSPDVW